MTKLQEWRNPSALRLAKRIRWTRRAGQLIWYKDAILRSISLESMENEMFVIKKEVFEKKPEQKPPPGYMYQPSLSPPRDRRPKTKNKIRNFRAYQPRQADKQP
ncbi:MAG TPA: hypothetical protein VGS11_00465 [Candidatus Bathyarchaeia archaeon]|nr:hypothetical protein [Candidatus Bathyarchaeia archaeon]